MSERRQAREFFGSEDDAQLARSIVLRSIEQLRARRDFYAVDAIEEAGERLTLEFRLPRVVAEAVAARTMVDAKQLFATTYERRALAVATVQTGKIRETIESLRPFGVTPLVAAWSIINRVRLRDCINREIARAMRARRVNLALCPVMPSQALTRYLQRLAWHLREYELPAPGARLEERHHAKMEEIGVVRLYHAVHAIDSSVTPCRMLDEIMMQCLVHSSAASVAFAIEAVAAYYGVNYQALRVMTNTQADVDRYVQAWRSEMTTASNKQAIEERMRREHGIEMHSAEMFLHSVETLPDREYSASDIEVVDDSLSGALESHLTSQFERSREAAESQLISGLGMPQVAETVQAIGRAASASGFTVADLAGAVRAISETFSPSEAQQDSIQEIAQATGIPAKIIESSTTSYTVRRIEQKRSFDVE